MLEGLVVQNNGVPIYVQLRNQIAAAIGRGELKPGDRLPTMREVAVALAIDLNTVQRAYTVLEDEGLLTLIQGRGTFVASAPKSGRNRQGETDAFAAMVAAQARAQGVDLEELREALRSLSRRAS
jgi:GntR family transcriptional regulator